MTHPYHHALSSVRRWGGAPEDYLPVHAWFDESKLIVADYRHRALRHHAEGTRIRSRWRFDEACAVAVSSARADAGARLLRH